MDHLKQLIKSIGGGGIALALLFLAFALGKEAGASSWLTGVVTVSLVFVAISAYTYRKHDSNGRKYVLLIAVGVFILSIAGIVNEYVRRFFTPSFLHFLLALSPGFLFAAYRAFLEKMAPNEFTENEYQDDGKN